MLDNADVMEMEELLVATAAGGHVELARVVCETERVGLDTVVLGNGPTLYVYSTFDPGTAPQ